MSGEKRTINGAITDKQLVNALESLLNKSDKVDEKEVVIKAKVDDKASSGLDKISNSADAAKTSVTELSEALGNIGNKSAAKEMAKTGQEIEKAAKRTVKNVSKEFENLTKIFDKERNLKHNNDLEDYANSQIDISSIQRIFNKKIKEVSTSVDAYRTRIKNIVKDGTKSTQVSFEELTTLSESGKDTTLFDDKYVKESVDKFMKFINDSGKEVEKSIILQREKLYSALKELRKTVNFKEIDFSDQDNIEKMFERAKKMVLIARRIESIDKETGITNPEHKIDAESFAKTFRNIANKITNDDSISKIFVEQFKLAEQSYDSFITYINKGIEYGFDNTKVVDFLDSIKKEAKNAKKEVEKVVREIPSPEEYINDKKGMTNGTPGSNAYRNIKNKISKQIKNDENYEYVLHDLIGQIANAERNGKVFKDDDLGYQYYLKKIEERSDIAEYVRKIKEGNVSAPSTVVPSIDYDKVEKLNVLLEQTKQLGIDTSNIKLVDGSTTENVDEMIESLEKLIATQERATKISILSDSEYELANKNRLERVKDIKNKAYHNFEPGDFTEKVKEYQIRTTSAGGDSWIAETFKTLQEAKEAIKTYPTDLGESHSIEEITVAKMSLEQYNEMLEKSRIANERLAESEKELLAIRQSSSHDKNGVSSGIDSEFKNKIELIKKEKSILAEIREFNDFGDYGEEDSLSDKYYNETINSIKSMNVSYENVLDTLTKIRDLEKEQYILHGQMNGIASTSDEYGKLYGMWEDCGNQIKKLEETLPILDVFREKTDRFVGSKTSDNDLSLYAKDLFSYFSQAKLELGEMSDFDYANLIQSLSKITTPVKEVKQEVNLANKELVKLGDVYRAVRSQDLEFFDRNPDGTGAIWATSEKDLYKTLYTGHNQGKEYSAEMYARNPLVIDAKGQNFNAITYLGDGTDESSIKITELYNRIQELTKAREESFNATGSETQEYIELSKQLGVARLEYDNLSKSMSNVYGTHWTDDFVKLAKANGYDALKIENVYDDTKQLATTFAVWSDEQVKNVQLIASGEEELLRLHNELIQANQTEVLSGDKTQLHNLYGDAEKYLGDNERLLSDIGLSYEKLIQNIQEENKLIKEGNENFRERVTFLNNGNVVESILGNDKNNDALGRHPKATKLVHTHPGTEAGEVFSINDMLSFTSEYLNNKITEFELVWKNQVLTMNLPDGLSKDLLERFENEFGAMWDAVRLQLGSVDENGNIKIPQELKSVASKYINGYFGEMVSRLGGEVMISKIDTDGKINQVKIPKLTSEEYKIIYSTLLKIKDVDFSGDIIKQIYDIKNSTKPLLETTETLYEKLNSLRSAPTDKNIKYLMPFLSDDDIGDLSGILSQELTDKDLRNLADDIYRNIYEPIKNSRLEALLLSDTIKANQTPLSSPTLSLPNESSLQLTKEQILDLCVSLDEYQSKYSNMQYILSKHGDSNYVQEWAENVKQELKEMQDALVSKYPVVQKIFDKFDFSKSVNIIKIADILDFSGIDRKITTVDQLKTILESLKDTYDQIEFNKYEEKHLYDTNEYDSYYAREALKNYGIEELESDYNLEEISKKTKQLYALYTKVKTSVKNHGGHLGNSYYNETDISNMEHGIKSLLGIYIEAGGKVEDLTTKMTKPFKIAGQEMSSLYDDFQTNNKLYEEESDRLKESNKFVAKKYELLKDLYGYQLKNTANRKFSNEEANDLSLPYISDFSSYDYSENFNITEQLLNRICNILAIEIPQSANQAQSSIDNAINIDKELEQEAQASTESTEIIIVNEEKKRKYRLASRDAIVDASKFNISKLKQEAQAYEQIADAAKETAENVEQSKEKEQKAHEKTAKSAKEASDKANKNNKQSNNRHDEFNSPGEHFGMANFKVLKQIGTLDKGAVVTYQTAEGQIGSALQRLDEHGNIITEKVSPLITNFETLKKKVSDTFSEIVKRQAELKEEQNKHGEKYDSTAIEKLIENKQLDLQLLLAQADIFASDKRYAIEYEQFIEEYSAIRDEILTKQSIKDAKTDAEVLEDQEKKLEKLEQLKSKYTKKLSTINSSFGNLTEYEDVQKAIDGLVNIDDVSEVETAFNKLENVINNFKQNVKSSASLDPVFSALRKQGNLDNIIESYELSFRELGLSSDEAKGKVKKLLDIAKEIKVVNLKSKDGMKVFGEKLHTFIAEEEQLKNNIEIIKKRNNIEKKTTQETNAEYDKHLEIIEQYSEAQDKLNNILGQEVKRGQSDELTAKIENQQKEVDELGNKAKMAATEIDRMFKAGDISVGKKDEALNLLSSVVNGTSDSFNVLAGIKSDKAKKDLYADQSKDFENYIYSLLKDQTLNDAVLKNVSVDKLGKTTLTFLETAGKKARELKFEFQDALDVLEKLENNESLGISEENTSVGKWRNISKNDLSTNDGYSNHVLNTVEAYNQLIKTEDKYQKLRAKEDAGVITQTQQAELNKIIKLREKCNNIIEESVDLTKEEQEAYNLYGKTYIEWLEKQYQQQKENSKDTYNAYIDSYKVDDTNGVIAAAKANTEKIMSELESSKSVSFKNVFKQANEEINRLNASLETGKIKVEGYNEEIQRIYKDLQSIIGIENKYLSPEEAKQKLEEYARNLPGKVVAEFNEETGKLNLKIKEQGKELQNLTMIYDEATGQIKLINKTSKETESIFKSLNSGIKGMAKPLAQYLKNYIDIGSTIQMLRRGISVIRELDVSLTEMRKVSDESLESLKKYQDLSFDIAGSIGTTAKQIQVSSANFMRLGYSLEEAAQLAKDANIYANVGDMEIEEATEHMISSIKAWSSEFNSEIEASSTIIDRYNEIGNNFAISSADIGSAMERSAAALKEGGNTLNESLGLIVAGNIIQQNAETTANALKILSLRIRGAKTDLEEMGEETDGLASSTSKMRGEIKALTGVDIMLDESTFKSTAQIIKEIGAIWEDLDDINQAAVLEKIAGKNRASTISGLLENYKVIDDVVKAAEDADGSALRENERYLDSIQGKIEQFTNEVQEFWYKLFDSDIVKGVIDFGTKIMSVINDIMDSFGDFGSVVAVLFAHKGANNILDKILGTKKENSGGRDKKFSPAIKYATESFSREVCEF